MSGGHRIHDVAVRRGPRLPRPHAARESEARYSFSISCRRSGGFGLVISIASSADPMSTQRSREEWQSLLAISFITLAIVSLVLVPLIGQRYVRPLHHEMKLLAEPGRGWVTQMHVALALQGAALRDYVETRLPGSAARFRDAADAQIVASDNLSLLAEKLGPEVQRRFADVRNLERRWHETAEAVVSAPLPEAGAMSSSQDLFESLLLASGRLDEAIDAASQTRRVRIEAAERTLRTVTMMLGFVALAAVVAVIALGRRVRQGALLAEQRRANLQEAVESRARLIRGISHDLKNPLNAIDGHAQLLLADMRGQLCEGQRDSIERIRAAAGSLIALVDDLLRLSIAESGQLRLHNREVDVANLVTEVCEGLRPGALAARHELSVS